MSFTWALLSDDLIIKDGTFVTLFGVEEVKQRLLISLRHYYQEYFLNVPAGVPWYEYILGAKDKKNVELILRGKILEVPGVVGIANFTIYRNELRDWIIESTVEIIDVQSSETIIVPLMVNFTETDIDESTGTGYNEFANIDVEFGNFNWNFGV